MKNIYIFASIFLCACNFNSSEKTYKKPSKEQIQCLKEYEDLYKKVFKDEIEAYKEVIASHDDEVMINYELATRRNKERLCMIKASCYEESKGIEFSDCINDVIPEQ